MIRLPRHACSGSALLLCCLALATPLPATAVEPTTEPPPVSCDVGPAPSATAAPTVRLWMEGEDADDWIPPPCTGWTEPGYRVLVELTGTIPADGDTDALLAQLGAVSGMRGLKYWSVSDQAWQILVIDSSALSSPDDEARRGDFTAEELVSEPEQYFVQADNRAGNPVIYRMRLLEAKPDRIALTVENATPIRKLFLTIADAGALQSLHVLERREESWAYRLLSRTGLGSMGLVTSQPESLVNRAAALYRHFAGLPDTMEPPAAP